MTSHKDHKTTQQLRHFISLFSQDYTRITKCSQDFISRCHSADIDSLSPISNSKKALFLFCCFLADCSFTLTRGIKTHRSGCTGCTIHDLRPSYSERDFKKIADYNHISKRKRPITSQSSREKRSHPFRSVPQSKHQETKRKAAQLPARSTAGVAQPRSKLGGRAPALSTAVWWPGLAPTLGGRAPTRQRRPQQGRQAPVPAAPTVASHASVPPSSQVRARWFPAARADLEKGKKDRDRKEKGRERGDSGSHERRQGLRI